VATVAIGTGGARRSGVRRSLRARRNDSHDETMRAQRVRLLNGMLMVAAEEGYGQASVERVLRRVVISRRTFYDMFADRDEMFVCLLEPAFGRVCDVARAGYEAGAAAGWADGIRRAVVNVLIAFEAEPHLARVCVVESLAAGPEARRVRAWALAPLVELIELGQRDPRCLSGVPDVSGAGVLGCAQELLHGHYRRDGSGEELGRLARQITYLIVSPFLGVRVGRAHADRAACDIDAALPALADQHADVPDEIDGLTLTDLQREALAYVSASPGCSRREVGRSLEIPTDAQAARLLRILGARGLAMSEPRGSAYTWTITPLGEAALRALERAAEPDWLVTAVRDWTPHERDPAGLRERRT
jgi:AcrR family transcriptional regulator